MKVLSCSSFYGSGSSAITDLLSEYSSAKPVSDYEFTFLYEPDGISDLEYNLVECFNRVNACVAIKRFLKAVKRNNGDVLHHQNYSKFFKKQYLPLSEKYINDLIDVKYYGYLDFDLRDRSKLNYLWLIFWRKVFNKIGAQRGGVLRKELTYCAAPSEDKFLDATRQYVKQLFEIYNSENAEYIVLDQVFPSTNVEKIRRYVPFESKIILVNRDPRDVYMCLRYLWTKETYPPSGKNVEEFCKWYEYCHQKAMDEAAKCDIVMPINFEDLIYKYDETVAKIEDFTGLKANEHCRKFERLNPKVSAFNTRVWERYPKEKENIEYIKKHLSKYLYNFNDKDVVVGK